MRILKSGWNFISKIEIKVLLSILAGASGLLLFIIIAGEVGEGSVQQLDNNILVAFRTPDNLSTPKGPEWLLESMRDITSLGGGAVLFIITLLVAFYLILRRNFNALFLVLAAVVGGVMLGMGLKELFGRVRPDIVPHLMSARSLSFPSGHSMMSAVVYLSLAALLAQIQERRRVKIFLILSAVILSFLIGISRVYLGVHFPSDVAAGWSIGLAWASFSWYISWLINQRRMIRRARLLDPKDPVE